MIHARLHRPSIRGRSIVLVPALLTALIVPGQALADSSLSTSTTTTYTSAAGTHQHVGDTGRKVG